MPYDLAPLNWQIHLCERAVKLCRHMDYLMFGKGLSHPFLALVDDMETVRSEIHGVPSDRVRGRQRSFLNKAFERSTAYTPFLKVDGIVQTLACNSPIEPHFPVLRSAFSEAARQYPKAQVRQPIVEAGQSDVTALWEKMKTAAVEIDTLALPYNRYAMGKGGYNCQTYIASILENVGLGHVKPSNALVTTGWKTLNRPANDTSAAPAAYPKAWSSFTLSAK